MKTLKSILAHLAAVALGAFAVAALYGSVCDYRPALTLPVGLMSGYASAFLFAQLGR